MASITRPRCVPASRPRASRPATCAPRRILLPLPVTRDASRVRSGDGGWALGVELRAYGWAAEYALGDRVFHYADPAWARSFPARAAEWASRDVVVEHRGEASLLQAAEALRSLPPRLLACDARAGAALARFVVERGLAAWEGIPVLVKGSLSEDDRAAIERAFGDEVFATYGIPALPFIAGECAAHEDFHVAMEAVLVEVIRPGPDGKPRHAAPGEEGDVVVTDLRDHDHPLFRFATGARGVAGPLARCSCSRGLRRLRLVGAA